MLDSAFASTGKFPKLNKKAKLIHSVHDLGLSTQAADEDIYQKAIESKCFVKPGKPGVIRINSQLSNGNIDKLVTEFISGKNPEDYKGKAIRI